MWFVGLVLGAFVGGIPFGAGGASLGAVAGVLAGLYLANKAPARANLETRILDLEARVQELDQQLVALQTRRPPVATAPPTPAVTAAAAQVPSTEQEVADTVPMPLTPRPVPASTSTSPQPTTLFSTRPVARPDEDALPLWLSRLFGGNILAKIGVAILFFGVASALKLAVDQGWFPIWLRLLLGASGAVVMTVLGYRRAQSATHFMFGVALQGGGLGILYLLVYFMLSRYQLLGESVAFLLFTTLGVGGILLAARQDGRSLAVLGISGAFLSPVLAGQGAGSAIVLFSYCLLLNLFILAVNWFKGWRELNITGFAFTLLLALNWARQSYQPSDFAVCETFLIVFFLLYSAMPVLLNRLQAPGRLGWGDGILIFGTPVTAATLQSHLLVGQDLTLAWHACAVGAYYLVLWRFIYRHPESATVWLEKSLLAIALGFFTLAIPLAFNPQLTSAFWTLEGLGVLYLGVRQDRPLARLVGSGLQLVAALNFFIHLGGLAHTLPLLNPAYLGCFLVAASALGSALLLRQCKGDAESTFASVFLLWSLAWWFFAGFDEIERFAAPDNRASYMLSLTLLSLLLLEWLGTARAWSVMRQLTLGLLPASVLAALHGHAHHGHALYGAMAMLLPLSLAAHYHLLYRHDRDNLSALNEFRHAMAYWFCLLLAGSELAWLAQRWAPAVSLWPLLAWGVVGAASLLFWTQRAQATHWPLQPHRDLYLVILQYPVALALWYGLLVANATETGNTGHWPYLPLINPLDLTQALVLWALWCWTRLPAQRDKTPAIYGAAFVALSMEPARLIHHWAGVPFTGHALFHSALLQASLSLLWTSLAVGLMVLATRMGNRKLWWGSFGLLTLVGVKLMLVDLVNQGTITWALSLIGIALLVIAASYYAPAPPKASATGAP